MALKLQIRFEGLCAFVPEKADGESAPSAMNVLLIDAREPGDSTVVGPDGKLISHAPHEPALEVHTRHVKAGAALPTGCTVANNLTVWSLDGEDLEIVVGPNTELVSGPFEVRGGRRPQSTRPAQGTSEAHDFTWVANLEGGVYPPGSLRVRRACVTGADPKAEQIAARIRLTSGALGAEVTRFSKDPVRFIPIEAAASEDPCAAAVASPVEQVLATQALYEIEFGSTRRGASIEITIASKQQGGRGLTLSARDGETVAVDLRNMPRSGTKPDTNFGPDRRCFVDVDFELIYRIADPRPRTLFVPSLHLTPPPEGGAEAVGTERPCGGGNFMAI